MRIVRSSRSVRRRQGREPDALWTSRLAVKDALPGDLIEVDSASKAALAERGLKRLDKTGVLVVVIGEEGRL